MQEERKQRKWWLFTLFKPVACAYTDVKIRELVNAKQIKGWEKKQVHGGHGCEGIPSAGQWLGHTSPGVPESPQGSCTDPSDKQVSGSSPTARVPLCACPQHPSPYHRSRHVPRLSFLGRGRAATLPLLTPRVCQITAIKGRKVQL